MVFVSSSSLCPSLLLYYLLEFDIFYLFISNLCILIEILNVQINRFRSDCTWKINKGGCYSKVNLHSKNFKVHIKGLLVWRSGFTRDQGEHPAPPTLVKLLFLLLSCESLNSQTLIFTSSVPFVSSCRCVLLLLAQLNGISLSAPIIKPTSTHSTVQNFQSAPEAIQTWILGRLGVSSRDPI